RLILLGLGASLAVAVGMVVVAERLDTSFHTLDEIRSFSRIPVLVSIPRIVTRADARMARRRFLIGVVSTWVGLSLIIGASYWIASGNQRLVSLVSHSGGQAR